MLVTDNTSTLLLWFGPVLFLLGGGVILVVILRGNRQDKEVAESLNSDEKTRLKQLLEGRE
jgi:cytochrome c-type biogenesis protein CcmH/NrfF